MILQRTHANRWVARRSRRQPAKGVITRIGSAGQAVYKTYALTDDASERLILRDATSLEVAFALLLAHHSRAQPAPAVNDPVHDAVAVDASAS